MNNYSQVARSFDTVATDYDRHETNPIRRWVRSCTRERLRALFRSGDIVLELNCGTGEEALELARQGVRVRAVDASPAMIEILHDKVVREGLEELITPSVLVNENLSSLRGVKFDGAFSNYGLNYVADLRVVAEGLRPLIKGSGAFSCVLASRYCLLETAALTARGDFREAFRRQAFRPERRFADGTSLPLYYHRAGEVAEAFSSGFKAKAILGLGVFIPPPYLSGFYTRHAKLFRILHALENRFRGTFPFSRLGDGLLMEFRRCES